MNTQVHFRRHNISKEAIQLLSIVILVLATLSVSARYNDHKGYLTFTDSITIKSFQSKKNHVTKLYVDATSEVLCFSSTGVDGKAYQIYLFTMDGRLATLARVGFKETTLLVQLQKGNYLYEVFSNDDRVENGSISLR